MLIYDAVITGSFSYNGVNISDVTGSEASINALNQFTSSYNTGSFTGSFIGNGSGLLGVVSASFATNALTASYAANVPLTASFAISASRAADSNNAISASFALNAATATSASQAQDAVSASFALNATSASQAQNAVSASQAQNAVSASFASNAATATSASQAQNAVSSSYASNTDLLDGKNSTEFAITGSNTFTGIQYIIDTTNPNGFGASASIYTDGGLRVTEDAYVSGTIYVNNLSVFGTQSINYITSSQLNISTNIISVNTDTPSIRFGGLSVYDSGSTQLTGSILWDSERDHWVYSNPSGSSYNSGMIISGPRNSGSLGTEQGTLNNVIVKGQGGDHVTSSQMTDDGTTVRIPGNLQVTGSVIVTSNLRTDTGLGLKYGSFASTSGYLNLFSAIIGSTATLSLKDGTGGYESALNFPVSANRSYTFPNADGTVALTSNIPTNNNQLTNGAGYITSAGNAATATTAITSNRVLFVSETNLNTAFTNTPAGQLSWTENFNQTNAPTPNTYYNTISMRHSNASNVYGNQLAIRWVDVEPNTYVRVVNNNVFGTWRAVLTDFNYGSYALPLSGGTLSGGLSGTTATFTGLTVNTGGTGTWGPFVVTSTSQWGDGGTQYVTIGAGGAAGIMINNPHIVWNTSEGYAGAKFGRSGGISSGAYYVIGTGASDNFFITKNGSTSSTQLNIDSGGNVYIGTSSAGGTLHVVGTGTVFIIGQTGASAKQLLVGIDSGTGTSELQSVWQGNSYTRLNLNPIAGAVFAGGTRLDTLSDSRVKDNIQPITGALDKVLSITGKKFHLKDEEEGKIRYGFIAQELEGILDEFVLQTNMTFKKDNLEVKNVKSIDNWASSWAALLVEAMKELKAEIDELKSR